MIDVLVCGLRLEREMGVSFFLSLLCGLDSDFRGGKVYPHFIITRMFEFFCFSVKKLRE